LLAQPIYLRKQATLAKKLKVKNNKFTKIPHILKFDDDGSGTVSYKSQKYLYFVPDNKSMCCKFQVIFHQYYIPARGYLPSKTHILQETSFSVIFREEFLTANFPIATCNCGLDQRFLTFTSAILLLFSLYCSTRDGLAKSVFLLFSQFFLAKRKRTR
jgi:hypothetical protein